jgi:hypothetical protein
VPVHDGEFALIDVPPVPVELMDVCQRGPDAGGTGCAGGCLCTHQVRMSWTADDDWFFEVVGAQAAVGTKVVVGAGAVGGRTPVGPGAAAGRRLSAGLVPLLRRSLGTVWLDVFADWLVDVHRIRTVAPAGSTARVELPPAARIGAQEGEFMLLTVIRRLGATGGGARLLRPGEPAPCWERTLGPGRVLLFDRRAFTLETPALCAADDREPAVQDLLVGVVSRCGRAPASAAG